MLASNAKRFGEKFNVFGIEMISVNDFYSIFCFSKWILLLINSGFSRVITSAPINMRDCVEGA